MKRVSKKEGKSVDVRKKSVRKVKSKKKSKDKNKILKGGVENGEDVKKYLKKSEVRRENGEVKRDNSEVVVLEVGEGMNLGLGSFKSLKEKAPVPEDEEVGRDEREEEAEEGELESLRNNYGVDSSRDNFAYSSEVEGARGSLYESGSDRGSSVYGARGNGDFYDMGGGGQNYQHAIVESGKVMSQPYNTIADNPNPEARAWVVGQRSKTDLSMMIGGNELIDAHSMVQGETARGQGERESWGRVEETKYDVKE